METPKGDHIESTKPMDVAWREGQKEGGMVKQQNKRGCKKKNAYKNAFLHWKYGDISRQKKIEIIMNFGTVNIKPQ